MGKEVFFFSNGLKLIIKEDERIPLVAVFLSIHKTGSINEKKYLGSGISHFLEHSIFLGSKNFPAKDQFSSFLEKKGADDFNAYTTFDYTAYYFTFLAKFFQPVLLGFFDFILNPFFYNKEVEDERGTILAEMDMSDDSPDDFFYHGMNYFLENNEFKKYPIIGLKSLFKKINYQDIKKFHKEKYVFKNMTLSVVGKVAKDKVVKLISSKLGSKVIPNPKLLFKKNKFYTFEKNNIYLNSQNKKKLNQTIIYKLFHPKAVYSKFVLIYHAPNFYSKEKPIMQVFSYLLGSGRASLLNLEIKNKHKYVLSIFSEYSGQVEKGFFKIFFTLKDNFKSKELEEKVELVTGKIKKILANLGDYIDEEKLSGVKEIISLNSDRRERSYLNLAYNNLKNFTHFKNLNYDQIYLDEINLITVEKIVQASSKWFKNYLPSLGILQNQKWKEESFFPNSFIIHNQSDLESKLEKMISSDLKIKTKKIEIDLTKINSSTLNKTQKKKSLAKKLPIKWFKLNKIPFIHTYLPEEKRVFFSLRMWGGQQLDGGIDPAKNNPKKRKNLFSPVGLGYLFTKMLFTTNDLYSKNKLNEIIRTKALNFFSTLNDNTFHLGFSCAKEKIEIAFRILKSMLTNGSFKKTDLELEKKNQLFAINQLYENSETIAYLEFKKKILSGSIFSYSTIGDRDLTKKINLENINFVLKSLKKTSQSYALTSGNLFSSDLENFKKFFPNFRLKKVIPTSIQFKKLKYINKENIYFSYQKDILQTHVHLGFYAPHRFSNDELVFKIIQNYLSGLGGPLFKLRSEGYTKNGKKYPGRAYSLGSFYTSAESYGLMVFYASLGSEHKHEYPWAIDSFLNELNKIKRKGISQTELKRVKNSAVVDYYKKSIIPNYRNNINSFYEANSQSYLSWATLVDSIKEITNDKIIQVLNEYFYEDNFLVHVMISN